MKHDYSIFFDHFFLNIVFMRFIYIDRGVIDLHSFQSLQKNTNEVDYL